jgi:hypothetical protein
MIDEIDEIIFLLCSLSVIWVSSKYILDTSRVKLFLPFLIFGFIMTLIFALLFNEIYDFQIWIIFQIIGIISIYMMNYIVYNEVLK